MLILKFIEEQDSVSKSKRKNRKKKISDKHSINRYSININTKNIVILELTESDLKREDVVTLLKVYKGRVLVPEKYSNDELLKEYIFSCEEYYKRAVISSLVNQLKTNNSGSKKVFIKTDEFTPYIELCNLVKYAKAVRIQTKPNVLTEEFVKICYNEFGAVVSINDENPTVKYDFVLDLDQINEDGKLLIDVNGNSCLLYPDVTYFNFCSAHTVLMQFNLKHNLICAAFSTK